jgi:rhamnogalacturonyl hydrolase YesR
MTLALLVLLASGGAAPSSLAAFQEKLLAVTTKHLDSLLAENGKVLPLKGKSSDAMTAAAYQVAYELTGKPKYRAAAVQLADRLLKAMRSTKFGVLYIKQKEKGPGREIPGGLEPALRHRRR